MNKHALIEFSPEYRGQRAKVYSKLRNQEDRMDATKWNEAFQSAQDVEDCGHRPPDPAPVPLAPSSSFVLNLFHIMDELEPENKLIFPHRRLSHGDQSGEGRVPKLPLKKKAAASPRQMNQARLDVLARPRRDVGLPPSATPRRELLQPQWVDILHVDYSQKDPKEAPQRHEYDPVKATRPVSPRSIPPEPIRPISAPMPPSAPAASHRTANRPRTAHRTVAAEPEGSKPLEWSKQFGEQGRRRIRSVRESTKKVSKPPASLAEDLLDIVQTICLAALDKLCLLLPVAQSFAEEYLDALRDVVRTADDPNHFLAVAIKLADMRKRTSAIVDSITSKVAIELSESETAFRDLLMMAVCVPNHRPLGELVIILAWALGGLRSDCIDGLCRPFIAGYRELFTGTCSAVKSGTHAGTDRGIVHEKVDQNTFKEAMEELKSFHEHADKLFDLSMCLQHHRNVINSSSILSDGLIGSAADDMPSAETADNVSDVSALTKESALFIKPKPNLKIVVDQFPEDVEVVKRPVSAGYRPVSRDAIVSQHAPRSFLQRYQQAKALYLQCDPVDAEATNSTSSNGKDLIIPAHIVMLACRTHLGLKCFNQVTNKLANMEMLSLDDVRFYKRHKHVMQEQTGAGEIGGNDTSAVPNDGSANGENSARGDGSTAMSGSSDRNAEVVDGQPADKDFLFVKIAPTLSSKQKGFLILSLLADTARAVILQSSKLVKHTFAGQVLTSHDIGLILGFPIVRIAPKAQIALLKQWLIANERSDQSFRPANPLLIDAALQRLYAFWPTMHVHLESSADPVNAASQEYKGQHSASNSKSDRLSECQLRLRWISRWEASKTFMEPERFQPNMNSI